MSEPDNMPEGALDTGDKASLQDRELYLRRSEKRRSAALCAFMEQPQGREWVWNLLEDCHVFASSFSANPHVTALREGERNIGLKVFGALMRDCPDLYSQMAKEAHERHDKRG